MKGKSDKTSEIVKILLPCLGVGIGFEIVLGFRMGLGFGVDLGLGMCVIQV